MQFNLNVKIINPFLQNKGIRVLPDKHLVTDLLKEGKWTLKDYLNYFDLQSTLLPAKKRNQVDLALLSLDRALTKKQKFNKDRHWREKGVRIK